MEAAVTYRGHGLGHLAMDSRSLRTLCGARIHSLVDIDLPDDGNLCRKCERIARRTHEPVQEADEVTGRSYTVAWRPRDSLKPALLRKNAGRKAKVKWLVEALGSDVSMTLAMATDREVARLYGVYSLLPEDRFTRPSEERRCRRCGQPVELEVHFHCPCGVDKALLDEADAVAEDGA